MSCDYSGLLPLLRTKSDVRRLRQDITELEGVVYKTDAGNVEKMIREKVRDDYAVIMYEQNISNSNIRQHVREIFMLIETMRELKITLSVEPTGLGLEEISRWVKQNLNKDVYLDIKIDPKIIGGAIFVWQGKYGDYSVRKKWDEMWRNKSKLLLERAGL